MPSGAGQAAGASAQASRHRTKKAEEKKRGRRAFGLTKFHKSGR